MIPFRVFDRKKKITWIVVNYHESSEGGSYLVAREDDSDHDGDLNLIPATELAKYRLVGFLDSNEQ